MAAVGKRTRAIAVQVRAGHAYPVDEALALLQNCPRAKFDESVDVSVNLGVDPRKSDQVVRGASVLPHGIGRDVRVAVFARGEDVDAASAAGADVVGYEDLAERIKGGELNFDVVISTPACMALVGRLGPVLGPRDLMPNPKVGTVAADVGQAVRNAKAGQVSYRTEKKGGIIHCTIGRLSFEAKALRENLELLLTDLMRLKPSAAKGIYIRRITISSTMGPGLMLDPASLDY